MTTSYMIIHKLKCCKIKILVCIYVILRNIMPSHAFKVAEYISSELTALTINTNNEMKKHHPKDTFRFDKIDD